MDKKTLSAHIRRNELAAFFKAAAQLNTAVEAWQNELVLLERRFVELEDQESDGVLSPEEASRLRNGISRDGMKLLDELDAFQPLHPAFPNVRKSKKSTLWLSLGAGVLAALLVWQFAPLRDNRPLAQDTSLVKPSEEPEKLKPEEVPANANTTPTSEQKTTPNIQKDSQTNREQTKKQGVALKITGNNDRAESEIATFLTKVLLEKGIPTHLAAKGGSYASAIDCRFSIDKTRTKTTDREDAFKLVITLTLTARNSDNVVCYTKRYMAEAQILRPEDEENEAVKKGLKSLREAITSSDMRACLD
ncbi:MAG: hypothetical protein SH848_08205 [Saprospiraceae bacterium]|nr:hypothetical protein [Saprospiraceae bacterium]